MKRTPKCIFALLTVVATVAAAEPLGGEVIGINNSEIVKYECGDNCWLTIKDDAGTERAALCVGVVCK
jgi:hypothetical protein